MFIDYSKVKGFLMRIVPRLQIYGLFQYRQNFLNVF